MISFKLSFKSLSFSFSIILIWSSCSVSLKFLIIKEMSIFLYNKFISSGLIMKLKHNFKYFAFTISFTITLFSSNELIIIRKHSSIVNSSLNFFDFSFKLFKVNLD